MNDLKDLAMATWTKARCRRPSIDLVDMPRLSLRVSMLCLGCVTLMLSIMRRGTALVIPNCKNGEIGISRGILLASTWAILLSSPCEKAVKWHITTTRGEAVKHQLNEDGTSGPTRTC